MRNFTRALAAAVLLASLSVTIGAQTPTTPIAYRGGTGPGVPYTGASANVNLGAYTLTAAQLVGGGAGITGISVNAANIGNGNLPVGVVDTLAVHLAGAETITGLKNFSGGINSLGGSFNVTGDSITFRALSTNDYAMRLYGKSNGILSQCLDAGADTGPCYEFNDSIYRTRLYNTLNHIGIYFINVPQSLVLYNDFSDGAKASLTLNANSTVLANSSLSVSSSVFVGMEISTQAAGGAGAAVTATCRTAGTFATGGGCECSGGVALTGTINRFNVVVAGGIATGWTCQEPGGTGGACSAYVNCSRLQ